MYRWFFCTTIIRCPGPLEQPPPGPVGPHWMLTSIQHLGALPFLPGDDQQPCRALAIALWNQSGEPQGDDDDQRSGCDVEAAGRT